MRGITPPDVDEGGAEMVISADEQQVIKTPESFTPEQPAGMIPA